MTRPAQASIWMIALALSWLLAAPLGARAAAAETLVAADACPAYQSIAKKTNPGSVKLTKGQSYHIVARNKQPPTYVQVNVDGATPKPRWVSVTCAAGGPAPTPSPTPKPGAGMATHLLALSWEPTFCKGHSDKTECKAETAQSADARQLSLHGLWPEGKDPFYCIADPAKKQAWSKLDGAGKWDQLPDPGLSPKVHDRLAAVMPGTKSLLERHEWIKHGTCFGGTADTYFDRAADLTEQVNASEVGKLISANAGKTVKASDIVAAFVKAFGPNAASAVAVSCPSKQIVEIDVYLAGDVAGTAPLSALLHKANKAGTCVAGALPLPKP